MSKDFYTSMEQRRSIYGICKETTISNERINELVKHAVKHVPSAFNSQSSRAVVLLGENHNKLWDIVMETLRKIVPDNKFGATEEKINSFRDGYGTVLFFDDTNVTGYYGDKFPLYKENFTIWAQHSSGMLQYAVWNLLEIEGMGASLQHYNPLIDNEVKKQWNIPEEWQLISQMPFGKPTASPDEKQFSSIEDRVKIFE